MAVISRSDAWKLLCEYNKEHFHLKHALTVEGVMRYFAQKLGYGDEADFWGVVGLLHDLDFEQFPEQHCIKEQEILRGRGVDEKLIHAVASHGYKLTVDIEPCLLYTSTVLRVVFNVFIICRSGYDRFSRFCFRHSGKLHNAVSLIFGIGGLSCFGSLYSSRAVTLLKSIAALIKVIVQITGIDRYCYNYTCGKHSASS